VRGRRFGSGAHVWGSGYDKYERGQMELLAWGGVVIESVQSHLDRNKLNLKKMDPG